MPARKSVSHGQIDPTELRSVRTRSGLMCVPFILPGSPPPKLTKIVAVAGDPDIVGIFADRNRFPGRERSRLEDSAPLRGHAPIPGFMTIGSAGRAAFVRKFRSGHSWRRVQASLPGQSHKRGGSRPSFSNRRRPDRSSSDTSRSVPTECACQPERPGRMCRGLCRPPVLGNAPSEFTEGHHKHAIEQPRCAEVGMKRLEGAGEFIEELEVRSRLCPVRVISGL